ncbi:hypothetical protein HDU96_008660 [Phlyctochytrium bullatum]|nr:hypothetical protein HDU96_008660 [Phlyctochytrium bullatum]
MHLVWPYVLIGYLRLGFTLFIMGLTVFLVVQFMLTVHHDLKMKAEEYSAEITQQVLDCSKQYAANRCSPAAERLPAMQALCNEWELCMARDPKEVGRLKVGAETLAEILNRLFEPMTYKTMIFGSILFFGSILLWSTAPSVSSLRSPSSDRHIHVAHPQPYHGASPMPMQSPHAYPAVATYNPPSINTSTTWGGNPVPPDTWRAGGTRGGLEGTSRAMRLLGIGPSSSSLKLSRQNGGERKAGASRGDVGQRGRWTRRFSESGEEDEDDAEDGDDGIDEMETPGGHVPRMARA